MRGTAYKSNGDLDSAIEDFSNLIKQYQVNEEQILLLKTRGLLYFDKGSYEESLNDFIKVNEIDPNDVDVFNNRGQIYHK